LLKQVPQALLESGQIVSRGISGASPVESGLLKSRSTIVHSGNLSASIFLPGGQAPWVGVGPQSEMGDPDVPAAGKGYISDFVKTVKATYQDPKPIIGRPPPRGKERSAWWYLTPLGRRMLDQRRDIGLFGGSQGGKVVPAYHAAIINKRVPALRGFLPKNNYLRNGIASVRRKARAVIREKFRGR